MAAKKKRARKTDERFTPPEVFVLRDRVWPGGVDTDPAWSPRSFSRARRCYTKHDNGLRQLWLGLVWLNPPWSDVLPWLERLLDHLEVQVGEPREGMLCVRNDPSTEWFKLAAARADAIAFLSKRTRYWQWNRRRKRLEQCGTPSFTSVIFYFGDDVDSFLQVFREDGHVAVRLHDHSRRGRVRAMAARKPAARGSSKSKLEQQVLEHVRTAIREYVRVNPNATFGELAGALGSNTEALMSMRVRELVADISAPRVRPAEPNGKNGHAKAGTARAASKPAKKTASLRKPAAAKNRTEPVLDDPRVTAKRTAEVRSAIAKLGKAEFTSNDIMDALGVSRQTALRTLAKLPEVQRIGKTKSATYQVVKT